MTAENLTRRLFPFEALLAFPELAGITIGLKFEDKEVDTRFLEPKVVIEDGSFVREDKIEECFRDFRVGADSDISSSEIIASDRGTMLLFTALLGEAKRKAALSFACMDTMGEDERLRKESMDTNDNAGLGSATLLLWILLFCNGVVARAILL